MKLTLKNVRLAFPVLFNPEKFQNTGDAAFSASFILEKNDPQVKVIQDAINTVAKDKWREKAEGIMKVARAKDLNCLHDGDLKSKLAGYAGNMYVSTRSTVRPTVVDRNRAPLVESDNKPYSGCYVNAIIELWVQDNAYGQRINCQLKGVQFVQDGDSFGASSTPASSDDFEDLAEGAFADDLA